jgi:FlgD Ig-like domain
VTRLSTGAFAVLVVATIGAFFVTQHLKVTTPLLAGTPRPDPAVIDPRNPTVCAGKYTGSTTISFYLLHRADDVDVYVVNAAGGIVRTLALGRHMRRGERIPDGVFHWNGREDNGTIAPDGLYYFRIALLHQGRTITVPGGPVRVSTALPHPVVTSVVPGLIPQDGSRATIRYSGTGGRAATVLMWRTDLPGAPRFVKSFVTAWNATSAVWDGKVHERPAPAGTYLVGLRVTDGVCHTAVFPAHVPPAPGSTPHAGVTVRYLGAEGPVDPVMAGSDATVRVQSAGLPYRWSLARAGARGSVASGRSSASTLAVRVPAGATGLYLLALRSSTGSTSVPLVVDAPRAAPVLVVLPALTWQGLNPVDDTGDGLPNTLTAGGPIELDRPLVDGLPAGFADEAGVLAYLDGTHRPYALTTDLGLIDGVGPGIAGHAAVVLAGSERWLPASEMAALRSYVAAGGRILNLGVDSLRRAVTVAGGRAFDPSAPSPVDALGVRAGASTAGASGLVTHRIGAGTVFYLGVPGFGASLAHDAGARAQAGRLWTALSG